LGKGVSPDAAGARTASLRKPSKTSPAPAEPQARTLAESVFSRLQEDIVVCRLKPGTPLRFETLKDDYGVSFSTLREALTALVAKGLVAADTPPGYRVASVSRADLIDLTDARVLIERELLKLAIQNGGDEWKISTATALHRMSLLEQRQPDPGFTLTPQWKAAHAAFHEALIAPGASPILLGIRANLYARAERYRSLSAIYRKAKRNKIDEHGIIMRTAFARKTDKAQDLIEKHIRSTTANMLHFAKDVLDKPQ
jgi:GntR family carbon starvation induced transcriptional regulator